MNEVSTDTWLIIMITFSFLANIFLVLILGNRITKVESKLRNKYTVSTR